MKFIMRKIGNKKMNNPLPVCQVFKEDLALWVVFCASSRYTIQRFTTRRCTDA